MKILITGITGQDGRILAEILLSEGHEVHGTLRPRTQNFPVMSSRIKLHYVDVSDYQAMSDLLNNKFDEIYNLAAQTHVGESFDCPTYTMKVNALGAMDILNLARDTPVYQASTSEMFGDQTDEDGRMSENTLMIPNSPYGIAKLAAHNAVRSGRRAYGSPHYAGILFNHESHFRGDRFVTKKVAVYVASKNRKALLLGNLDAARDWGSAFEYCEAMVKILRAARGDYVVATGHSHTVKQWVEACFRAINDHITWEDNRGYDMLGNLRIVGNNEKYKRPLDIDYLCGNPTLIQNDLHWRAKSSLEDLADNMVNALCP
jgi:GDPmannose 4,6-dehydratase